MSKPDTKKIQVTLPTAVYRKIQKMQKAEGYISVSATARHLLMQALKATGMSK